MNRFKAEASFESFYVTALKTKLATESLLMWLLYFRDCKRENIVWCLFTGLCLHTEYIRFHISELTYAYLIIRLGVSDALEFKLVERVGKLPLGRWQTWKNGEERNEVVRFTDSRQLILLELTSPSYFDLKHAHVKNIWLSVQILCSNWEWG